MKRWKLLVVVVALSIDLTPPLVMAPEGDPLSGVQWHLQKAQEAPYLFPRIEETKPQVFKPQNEETKSEGNHQSIGSVKIEPIVNEQSANPQANNQKSDTNWPVYVQAMYNILVTLFTMCLFGVGVLQYRVYKAQALYMREGLRINEESAKAAKQAADAAKESAEATKRSVDFAVQMERPWIQVVPDGPVGWPPIDKRDFKSTFGWVATNIGRSPAFLTRLYVAGRVVDSPAPPDQVSPYQDPPPFAEYVLAPRQDYKGSKGFLIEKSDVISMLAGEKCFAFFGFIEYRDTAKRTHCTRFCSYWVRTSEGWNFFPVGPPSTVEYT